VTARVFTLLGPYMPLAEQFAAGNFLRDALAGKTVSVAGDGTALRSYLYAGDLVVWLLHLLVHGQPGKAYNVGSENAVSIAELARVTATTIGNGKYKVLGKSLSGVPPARYLPDTRLIRESFGVRETVDLVTAIQRSAHWFSAQS
jgi:dTDP-glucose 4,6-dehydratase